MKKNENPSTNDNPSFTPFGELAQSGHVPPLPNGCTCYAAAPSIPVFRKEGHHLEWCPVVLNALEFAMNTPINAGKEPCNYCEGAGRVETAPCVSDVCPVCKGERYCTTPPTQSQEGETEVDTAHKQFHAQDEYAHHPGVSLEFARNLHSRLTAAQRKNDRLRSEVAGLKADKERLDWLEENPVHEIGFSEDLRWLKFNGENFLTLRAAIDAARAATEEKKQL